MKKINTYFVYFVDIIKISIFPSFKNGSTRSEWWLSKILMIIPVLLLIVLLSLINYIFKIPESDAQMDKIGFTLLILLFLFILYTQINISLKRLKDIGISKYFIILLLIPPFNVLIFLVLGFCHAESDEKNKITIKKLFLLSFDKNYHFKLIKKLNFLPYILSALICIFIFITLNFIEAIVLGISSKFSESIITCTSTLISSAVFFYTVKNIYKKTNK